MPCFTQFSRQKCKTSFVKKVVFGAKMSILKEQVVFLDWFWLFFAAKFGLNGKLPYSKAYFRAFWRQNAISMRRLLQKTSLCAVLHWVFLWMIYRCRGTKAGPNVYEVKEMKLSNSAEMVMASYNFLSALSLRAQRQAKESSEFQNVAADMNWMLMLKVS